MASVRRARANASSASAWRPDRYRASISCPHSRSSNGCSAASDSSSATSSPVAPGRQVGVDPQQQRLQPLLLQRASPLGDPALARDVAQRLAAEQPERRPQQRPRVARGRLGLAPRVRRTGRSQAAPPRCAASIRRARAPPARRADRAALTGARAAPRPRSPEGCRPTVRRSDGHARAELRRPSETTRAANVDVRSGGPLARHRARTSWVPGRRTDNSPRSLRQGIDPGPAASRAPSVTRLVHSAGNVRGMIAPSVLRAVGSL